MTEQKFKLCYTDEDGTSITIRSMRGLYVLLDLVCPDRDVQRLVHDWIEEQFRLLETGESSSQPRVFAKEGQWFSFYPM